MESRDPRIIKIADKYEDRIRQEFSEYVDFSKVEDMITNISIVDYDFLVQNFGVQNAAAITDEKSGHIYCQ